MASWIKFDTTTPDKPEVWQIAADLGIDPDAVVGKLLRVWTWFDTHSENGNAPVVTKVTLDRHVGNAGFCDAMVRAGWMYDDGVSIGLPNFERHNGQTAKNRALTAVRVANHKRNGNGDGVTSALPREEKEKSKKEDQEHRATRSPSGSRLPADWNLPDDWIPVAETIGVPVGAVVVESNKFRDHWLVKSGKDGRKADWLACWRTWCRNAVEWTYQPKQGGQHGADKPVRLTAVDRAIADNEQHRLRREGSAGRTIDG